MLTAMCSNFSHCSTLPNQMRCSRGMAFVFKTFKAFFCMLRIPILFVQIQSQRDPKFLIYLLNTINLPVQNIRVSLGILKK